MPDIKDSVGEGGINNSHDVAIVQLMLRLVKNAKNVSYLAADYTGSYSPGTKDAIIAFQKDHKLLAPPPLPGAKLPAAPAAEKEGFIDKASQTLTKLAGLLPAKYKDMRSIENTKTVYLPMEQAKADTTAKKVGTSPELDPTFRSKVQQLVNEMYTQHKIALSIPADGWRRDFAAQAKLSPAVTGAGPGESNHQYGQAVDIGFQGLHWIAGDGSAKEEDFWLAKHKDLPAAKKTEFWQARDQIGSSTSNRGPHTTAQSGA